MSKDKKSKSMPNHNQTELKFSRALHDMSLIVKAQNEKIEELIDGENTVRKSLIDLMQALEKYSDMVSASLDNLEERNRKLGKRVRRLEETIESFPKIILEEIRPLLAPIKTRE